MNAMNLDAYKEDSVKVEQALRKQGFMRGEIATIGYLMLLSNIEALKLEVASKSNITDLIKEAKELIDKY